MRQTQVQFLVLSVAILSVVYLHTSPGVWWVNGVIVHEEMQG
jgi:hypothetical protein